MSKRLALFLLWLLAAAFVPASASAQMATTVKNVHLRAGPAREYPVVAILPAGIAVEVVGCLSSYSWCDVIVGADRGWVYAGNIDYPYQGAYVPLYPYGARIGIAIVPFIFFSYWGDHYRDRPWYRDRDRWAHPPRRPAPPVLRPPPGGRPLPPPHAGPGPRPPAPPPHAGPGPRPPPGSQPNPPGHRPPAGPPDRRHPPTPPPGMSRQSPSPPARGPQGEAQR